MRAMSTINVEQPTCDEEEQKCHGTSKADHHQEQNQQHQQQQQHQNHQWTRRRVGLAGRSPVDNSSQGRRCARCGGAFGRFYNTGASCPRCRLRVCRQCREFRGSDTANNKGEQTVDWLCAVCHKIAQLHAATGEWIYETGSVTSNRRVADGKKSTVDIIKRSIKRAWTINGPPARWSVARKSPAFRIYRSLPIREKIESRTDIDEDIDDESFSLPPSTETIAKYYDEDTCSTRSHIVEDKTLEKITTTNERTRNEKKRIVDNSTFLESARTKNNERDVVVGATESSKTDRTDCPNVNESTTHRISLIKPPRIIAKFGTIDNKQIGKHHGDKKSNIPIFRRSSREFEDIGSPQETAKRSLIPQRYRASTDDLRRSREDISVPSLIPKLFSPRAKDTEKLKRPDSKDDVRQIPKLFRRENRDSTREETRISFSSPNVREDHKSSTKIARRDDREDVGGETTSLPSLCGVNRGKNTCKDDNNKTGRTESTRVGETITRSKSCPTEQGKTASKSFSMDQTNERKIIVDCKNEIIELTNDDNKIHSVEHFVDKMANEKTIIEQRLDGPNVRESSLEKNAKTHEKDADEEMQNLIITNAEIIEPIIIKNNEMSSDAMNFGEIDFSNISSGEKKSSVDAAITLKKMDDPQVVRRKFSKDEFSNPDDTDETPNRRSSSHLSPEASPLSTRSSRYSPRESESEPTPALPRKIGSGDYSTASQRIRDAITRTRRESNSSARYESSGSESVRLSEPGLHGYADLARRVKLFGSGGTSPGPSAGSDEPIQRDSATSAGEDDPSEDCHSRGPGSSQGRTMLRRRRQFDAQGSRRRGRSHARTCCGEELQNLQSLHHVIGRGGGGRHPSPIQGQNPESTNPDYRRLVFISSDSSSGREEDDADSSCSGSSYPKTRNNHSQSLEDCDWDYFESGTLPLPGIGLTDVGTTVNVGHGESGLSCNWIRCCPGRGSTSCLACGGSPGANVLPVPVPIPVPVPYPVPVPASLWTVDFAAAAAASSMITRGTAPEGTLRLRGDPSAPWFSWHPRFTQSLNTPKIDPRHVTAGFDPTSFGFPTDEATPRLDAPTIHPQSISPSSNPPIPPPVPITTDSSSPIDAPNDVEPSKSPTPKNPPIFDEDAKISIENLMKDNSIALSKIDSTIEQSAATTTSEIIDEQTSKVAESSTTENSVEDDEDSSSRSTSSSNHENDDRMYNHSRENSASSSGRSSADSSDLEDSASHRFSRVFVVNDDSLTSDNDIDDNDDSDSARPGVVTLKRVTSRPEQDEPVVLRRVRLLDEDMNHLNEPENPPNPEDTHQRRHNRIEHQNDVRRSQRDPDANEIYLASSVDNSDNHIQLKSIRNINPDVIDAKSHQEFIENQILQNDKQNCPENLDDRSKNWDSVITPDSLEVVDDLKYSTAVQNDNSILKTETEIVENSENQENMKNTSNPNESQINDDLTGSNKSNSSSSSSSPSNDAIVPDVNGSSKPNNLANSSTCSTTDTSETNTTTCSELSSDELHEYEVTPNPQNPSPTPRSSSTPTPTPPTHEKIPNHEPTIPKRRQKLEPPDSPTNFHPADRTISSTPKKSTPPIAPRSKIQNPPQHPQKPKNPTHENLPNSIQGHNVGEIISTKIHEIFKNSETNNDEESRSFIENSSSGIDEVVRDGSSTSSISCTTSSSIESAVRGEKPGRVRQVGESEVGDGGERVDGGGSDCETVERRATARFTSVERRPPTREDNDRVRSFATSASVSPTPDQSRQSIVNSTTSNKYRSLVMITQGTYHPVSVITSDTTTLLQPPEVSQSSQGLAGYFHLALESANEPRQRNGQPPRRPLMVKRLGTSPTSNDLEIDSGLSVGSASENDDVQIVNIGRNIVEQSRGNAVPTKIDVESDDNDRTCLVDKIVDGSSRSNDDGSSLGSGGVVILEEGLADDDSWVEEVSHDEDEQSAATTATESSSEDESNNLGDREEELRGYHRQAIDFTLHTIVEESCEESEAEPSLTTGNPRKKQRPPSASELEKYFFFGLGGDTSSTSIGSREIDSLSETSSIYSEGLESLGQDDAPTINNQDPNKVSNEFLNSSRLEKYFLSEFLGFDRDRRDSDGSVGSDSEGHPSPEAQRRKRLVRARGTGRSSHSSSLDNLLALASGSQNLSSQNSLQDLTLNAEGHQDTLSEGSSTETDGNDDCQTPAFGTDGQFDTVKRKKKKPRTLGTQSPRVVEDRNKTPEPREITTMMTTMNDATETLDVDGNDNTDDERSKTPQPDNTAHSSSSSSSQIDGNRCCSSTNSTESNSNRGKQQSRDSGFVGSCDDLLQSQKSTTDGQGHEGHGEGSKEHSRGDRNRGSHNFDGKRNHGKSDVHQSNDNNHHHHHHQQQQQQPPNASLSRKDSFNNWSSDEETNLMMSKMRQFFKTMVGNSPNVNPPTSNSSGPSPAPSPRLSGYAKSRGCPQNRTKPPQLVYFENELTRLMKTVPGIRDEQVREIVEYLSSEDTWSDSYDSSDYTSSDLEGAASGRRSALQEQISQSCQQIIDKFDGNLTDCKAAKDTTTTTTTTTTKIVTTTEEEKIIIEPQPCLGRDTAFVYQKLVQSFTKIAADGPTSNDNKMTPHSSPPLIAKVMHHIGSRLVALMHEVSEGGSTVQPHTTWRRYSQHHRTPSSASTTEDDDSTSDSTNPTSSSGHLPRSKSHDPLLLINGHPATTNGPEGEEREASDYERFSWRGSFESALMAADSRTKLSLLACSGDVSASASASALAMAAKRRSAGDLLFNPKSFSREQLDRVRSCGSIGGGGAGVGAAGGSIEEKIWSNRRRSSVPDANTRGESGASAGDDDTEDELEYGGDSRATTLPRGMQNAAGSSAATNSLPRLSATTVGGSVTAGTPSTPMHKAHSVYHFMPQHTGVKSARYRPPGFARNSLGNAGGTGGPKRAVSAPGLQAAGTQVNPGKRENSRNRRQQTISLTPDDGSSLSEACSTPIIGAGSRAGSSNTVMDIDDMDRGLHSGHLATRASLSSLGARSDSMASVYSGAGEGRWCGSVAVRGEVEFSLQYDYKQLTFEVHVTQCKDLAPVDIKRNRSDPYVKIYLLPDKSKSGKRKTKVKKHTLNPVFDETLKFHTSLNGLETRTLWLTVWHSDMFGRNDFLGEVRMSLENKIFDDPTPRWYPLQERTEPFDDPISYKGEVIVGLKFIPPDPAQLERERESSIDHRGLSKGRKNWSRGSLHVLVKEARNLQTRAKNSGTCDPFCKSYLLPDKGRSGKQKTGVVRRSGGSPVWTHTFVYKDVSLQELAERGLELTVWDHDRIASNEFLGGVRFNLGTGKHYGKVVDWMDATGRELSLWQSMLERPNFWVEGAVTLRPNLHNHVKSGGT